MQIDLYVKTILTLIAVALLVIATNSVLRPTTASAQGSLSGVQFLAAGRGVWAIDTRTGDVWQYPYGGPGPVEHVGKITRLGNPFGQ
jgi:hypothetical protein